MLERGDEDFLLTLIAHAEQRALRSPRCAPRTLVRSVSLPRLYNPHRVRRRDLVAKGDAFRLFHEVHNRVHREGRERERGGRAMTERDADQLWWKHLSRLMTALVDGYNFDKSPTAVAAARRERALTSTLGTPSHDAKPMRTVDDEYASFTDIFFWAIVSGQPRLVEVLWGHVQDPLRCSVVGGEVCRRVRKRCFSRGRGKVGAKRLLDTIETCLEEGLTGILDNRT